MEGATLGAAPPLPLEYGIAMRPFALPGTDSDRSFLPVDNDSAQDDLSSRCLSPEAASEAASTAEVAATPKQAAEPPADKVELLPSCFAHRPPTIFFELPATLAPRRLPYPPTGGAPAARMQVPAGPSCPLCMRMEKNANSVRHAFKRARFGVNMPKEPAPPLVTWSRHTGDKLFTMLPLGAVVNHFPGSWTLGRKDGLSKVLIDQQRRLGGSEYSFFPRTFTLPQDRQNLERALSRGQMQGGGCFIVKPLNSSRGRGIFITDDLDELEPDAKVLVQEYIDRPLLLQERKFDLRIYVLVTSFDPLRAYTFDQGLARFATQPYTPPTGDDHDRCAQLTNYSINKKNADYEANEDANEDGTGHKWSLAAAFRALAEQGHDMELLHKRIDLLLAKTLIAAQPSITQKYNTYFRRRNACFELFGFDVMLDSNVRPWLIEVNVSPDLASTSPLDRQLKGTLAADTLHLVGIQAPASLAAAAGAPAPPSPRSDEPPLFTRHHGSGHQASEMDRLPFSSLSETERLLLVETEEEWMRASMTGFRRIYPSPDASSQQRLLRLFETVRNSDALVSAYSRRPDGFDELHACLLNRPPSTRGAPPSAAARNTYKPDRQWARATTPTRGSQSVGQASKPRSSSSRSVHRHVSRTRALNQTRTTQQRASSARANLTPSKGVGLAKAHTPAARRTPNHRAALRPHGQGGTPGSTISGAVGTRGTPVAAKR